MKFKTSFKLNCLIHKKKFAGMFKKNYELETSKEEISEEENSEPEIDENWQPAG